MKDRPILFSGPLVRALLAGTKTQTRRLVKPQPEPWTANPAFMRRGDDVLTLEQLADCCCPYGKPADRLWVRESLVGNEEGFWCYEADNKPIELARDDPRCGAMISWAHHNERERCNSIHMPRWASRITLEVTSVRVQRVTDITEEDAKAEGVEPLTGLAPEQQIISGEGRTQGTRPYTLAFAVLWDTINDKDGCRWVDRPWVWCVSFRRLP